MDCSCALERHLTNAVCTHPKTTPHTLYPRPLTRHQSALTCHQSALTAPSQPLLQRLCSAARVAQNLGRLICEVHHGREQLLLARQLLWRAGEARSVGSASWISHTARSTLPPPGMGNAQTLGPILEKVWRGQAWLRAPARGVRGVRSVRGEGRGASDQYGVRGAACPISTG